MLQIFEKYTKRVGHHRIVLYKTSEGILTQSGLAKKIGVVEGTVIQRIRLHGLHSPEVVKPNSKTDKNQKCDTIGRADWEGLGSKPRIENLPDIEPGIFEKKYL